MGTIVACGRCVMAIANARQYGNGALIAPEAQLDDGKLDIVVVDHRPAWRVLMHAPRLFSGTVAQVPGVSMTTREHCRDFRGRPRSCITSMGSPISVGSLSRRAYIHGLCAYRSHSLNWSYGFVRGHCR